MIKLIPLMLALGCVAASAQSSDNAAALNLRLDSLPGNARLATGLTPGPALARLGLHVDSGQWHFDLALPDAAGLPGPYAVGGVRNLRMTPEVSVGISRSFGSAARSGTFWDTGNFSLVANAGYAPLGRTAEDLSRWSGGLGAAWKFSSASSLGLNYRIEASALPEGAAARSLGLSYGYQFTPGLRLDTSLGRGLSDGAPRWGGGLSISFSH
jgi:hypothetical protein